MNTTLQSQSTHDTALEMKHIFWTISCFGIYFSTLISGDMTSHNVIRKTVICTIKVSM